MGKDALRLSTVLAATPQVIFRAWLDSTQHASFTNELAKIDGNIGGKFTLRDGKVTGRTMALEFGRRLLQSWRNTDFPKGAPDSRLEVVFESVGAGTRMTVMHADLPEGLGEPLRRFWSDAYFGPMTDYFGRFATLLANTPPSQAVILVEDDEEEPEPPPKLKKLKGDKSKPESAPAKAPTLVPAKDEKAKKGKPGPDEKPVVAKAEAPKPKSGKVEKAESKPAKVEPKASKPAKPEPKPSKPAKAEKPKAKPVKAKAKAEKPKAKPEKAKPKAKPAKAEKKAVKPKPKAAKEKPKAKAAKPKTKAKKAKR